MGEDVLLVDKLISRFCVEDGTQFRLDRFATKEPHEGGLSKQNGKDLLAKGVMSLAQAQDRLYADRRWMLLIVFQAMDAGGKDGTIKHVFSGVNPQGISTVSFKPPGPDELAHDFLWRVHHVLPARGMIGILNRSHYEEVLVARVHPELVANQHLPEVFTNRPDFWPERIADIRAFESYLARQGTRIIKFFLHISPDEQKRRLLARLDDPEKLWKFDPGDLRERTHWDAYMQAYQDAIAGTATPEAPWYVVPADQKWFARLVVVSAINAAMNDLGLRPVEPSPTVLAQIAESRRGLQ